MKVDLHIHTIYSDGVFSPERIVETAIDAGLNAIANTDHDNVLAYPIATAHAKKIAKENSSTPLEIIPGVEINTIYKNTEIHILGYFMNREISDFVAMLKSQQKARIKQTEEILHLLNKKEGINITLDKLKTLVAEGGSIGRPHIAKAITNAGGTSNVMEAYSKYIHRDSAVYVERKTVSPFDATNKTVLWTSSNPSVATVADGVVVSIDYPTVRKILSGEFLKFFAVLLPDKVGGVIQFSFKRYFLYFF